MNEKKHYTEEELLKQIEMLKKTIKVQNETINRLMEAYVFNKKTIKRVLLSAEHK